MWKYPVFVYLPPPSPCAHPAGPQWSTTEQSRRQQEWRFQIVYRHTHTYKGVLLISLFQQPALANKSSGWNHLLCCDAPDEKMQRQREPDCECEGGRVCEGGSDGEHGKKGRKGGHALCVSAHLYSKPVCLSIFLFHTPSILLSLHLPPLHLSIQPCPFLSWEPGLNITVKRSERMLQTKEMVSEVWESFSGAGFGSGSAIDDY